MEQDDAPEDRWSDIPIETDQNLLLAERAYSWDSVFPATFYLYNLPPDHFSPPAPDKPEPTRVTNTLSKLAKAFRAKILAKKSNTNLTAGQSSQSIDRSLSIRTAEAQSTSSTRQLPAKSRGDHSSPLNLARPRRLPKQSASRPAVKNARIRKIEANSASTEERRRNVSTTQPPLSKERRLSLQAEQRDTRKRKHSQCISPTPQNIRTTNPARQPEPEVKSSRVAEGTSRADSSEEEDIDLMPKKRFKVQDPGQTGQSTHIRENVTKSCHDPPVAGAEASITRKPRTSIDARMHSAKKTALQVDRPTTSARHDPDSLPGIPKPVQIRHTPSPQVLAPGKRNAVIDSPRFDQPGVSNIEPKLHQESDKHKMSTPFTRGRNIHEVSHGNPERRDVQASGFASEEVASKGGTSQRQRQQNASPRPGKQKKTPNRRSGKNTGERSNPPDRHSETPKHPSQG
eukprot:Gb_07595 [translate_table: standard]